MLGSGCGFGVDLSPILIGAALAGGGGGGSSGKTEILGAGVGSTKLPGVLAASVALLSSIACLSVELRFSLILWLLILPPPNCSAPSPRFRAGGFLNNASKGSSSWTPLGTLGAALLKGGVSAPPKLPAGALPNETGSDSASCICASRAAALLPTVPSTLWPERPLNSPSPSTLPTSWDPLKVLGLSSPVSIVLSSGCWGSAGFRVITLFSVTGGISPCPGLILDNPLKSLPPVWSILAAPSLTLFISLVIVLIGLSEVRSLFFIYFWI